MVCRSLVQLTHPRIEEAESEAVMAARRSLAGDRYIVRSVEIKMLSLNV
jgi:hypothetical protein